MRVVVAVNDVKTVDRIVAGALNYGVSDGDEIAVITVVNTDGLKVWSVLPQPLIAEIQREVDEDAKVTLREAGQFLRSELHSPHVTEYKLEGDLIDQLHSFLTRWKAELLIIGFSENMPWADQASRIVTSAPCPVLVVGKHSHEESPSKEKAPRKGWHEPNYIV